ncbi:hypothetical protein ACFYW6_33920 [Streptomyces sp. NPDC002659]|uniref:hypothetical protein n=1 Tax=Streptomyces sp. NPDC002659 TaxID=3364656 RepID=UPI0036C35E87
MLQATHAVPTATRSCSRLIEGCLSCEGAPARIALRGPASRAWSVWGHRGPARRQEPAGGELPQRDAFPVDARASPHVDAFPVDARASPHELDRFGDILGGTSVVGESSRRLRR